MHLILTVAALLLNPSVAPEAIMNSLPEPALEALLEPATTTQPPVECQPDWAFVSGDIGPGHLNIGIMAKCCPNPKLLIGNANSWPVRLYIADDGGNIHYDSVVPPATLFSMEFALGCPPATNSAALLTISQSVGGGSFSQVWQLNCESEECIW